MTILRYLLLTATLGLAASLPAGPAVRAAEPPLASSVQAMLEAHQRALPGSAGQAFRDSVSAAVAQSQRLRERGNTEAADQLLEQTYRRLTLAIRDAKQAPGDAASAVRAATRVESDASRQRGAADMHRRLLDAQSLLAMIRRQEPGETAEQQALRAQRSAEFEARLEAIRQLQSSDPAAALEDLDRLYQDQQTTLRQILENDANKRLAPSATTTPDNLDKRRHDFQRLDASVNELLRAQARIIDAEHPGDNPERQVARSATQLRAEAAALFEAGRMDAAQRTLDQAYALIQHSVLRLREGRTLVRRLEFDSPQAEYAYELQRHDMHLELAALLMRTRAEDPAVGRLGQRVMVRSTQMRQEAEKTAAAGKHGEAVKALEKASSEIYKLFRIAGFYIPN